MWLKRGKQEKKAPENMKFSMERQKRTPCNTPSFLDTVLHFWQMFEVIVHLSFAFQIIEREK